MANQTSFNSRLREEATTTSACQGYSVSRFNSRLREEATCGTKACFLSPVRFNSRLREEATLHLHPHGAQVFKVSTHASVRRRHDANNDIAWQDYVSTHASVRRRRVILVRKFPSGVVSTHASVRRRQMARGLCGEGVQFQLTPP